MEKLTKAIIVIVVLLVLVLIGAVGFYIWKKKQSDEDSDETGDEAASYSAGKTGTADGDSV